MQKWKLASWISGSDTVLAARMRVIAKFDNTPIAGMLSDFTG